MFKEYASYYDLIYKDKPYKKEANFVFKWANQPRSILELGGGTCKHAKHWKAKDIYVVDKSSEMMLEAGKLGVNYYIADIREYDFAEIPKVNAVFAMFNVVGYADPIYYMDRLPLKKGGFFIFDCWDSAVIEEEPPEYNCKTYGDIDRIIVPTIINYSPYIKLQITIVKDHKPLFTEDHIVRSYWRNEIETLCEAFNYKLVDFKNDKGWVTWCKLRRL